jgi:uncharacterized membrane protein
MILMHLFTLSHLEGLLFKKLNLFTMFVSFHRVNSVLSILFFSVDITLSKSYTNILLFYTNFRIWEISGRQFHKIDNLQCEQ